MWWENVPSGGVEENSEWEGKLHCHVHFVTFRVFIMMEGGQNTYISGLDFVWEG